MEIKKSIREKVEACLRKNEGASSVIWGEDSCTTFDENNQVIEDYMIDIEDDEIFYTPVLNYGVTLSVILKNGKRKTVYKMGWRKNTTHKPIGRTSTSKL